MRSPAPLRSFLTVADTAIRWQVTPLDIAGCDRRPDLSIGRDADGWHRRQAGRFEDGRNRRRGCRGPFRRDGASRKPALVRRFRRSKKSEWELIARPTDCVPVDASDVIILRREFERCERAWGLFDASGVDTRGKTSGQAKRSPGPGTPPKHDWDAFAGAIVRRVHDHGMPVSQGELVRDMMDWFASREDFPPPDERTVRQKVSAIWKELVSAAP